MSICSILEALRKSLEGTQSRKTFFEEYCNTFSSTDPCKIKEMHTEVESAQGSEGYANQGTSLPKPHGNLTSYKVVAASKDEEVFYSIGECQAACLGHGEEECSCPVGYISIVVTAVTEPPLAREHMVHLEDFEFPLDEESGIRFIPTVGIQTNQTLQYVLQCPVDPYTPGFQFLASRVFIFIIHFDTDGLKNCLYA